MKFSLPVLAVAGLLAFAPAALGATITFNFEDVPVSVNGVYSSLTVTNQGLTMTLYRSSGLSFDVNTLAGAPVQWGSHSLSTNTSMATTSDSWIADFSVVITQFSAQAGDYGRDNDTPVSLTAYSDSGAAGSIVASASYTGWTSDFSLPDYLSIGVTGPNFSSVGFTSDSSFLDPDLGLIPLPFFNSLFWDNFTVEVDDRLLPHPVPDAGSTLGLGVFAFLGLALVLARDRVTVRTCVSRITVIRVFCSRPPRRGS
jgi:hypothetical protein